MLRSITMMKVNIMKMMTMRVRVKITTCLVKTTKWKVKEQFKEKMFIKKLMNLNGIFILRKLKYMRDLLYPAENVMLALFINNFQEQAGEKYTNLHLLGAF